MATETREPTPLAELPESSPLWSVVLVLGEIAERVEREQVSEPTVIEPKETETVGVHVA